MAKFYEVVSVSSANKYLPVPLQIGEIVMKIEDPKYEEEGFNGQFMKVYHNAGKNIGSFSRVQFERYSLKGVTKGELLLLRKKKGRLPKIDKDGK